MFFLYYFIGLTSILTPTVYEALNLSKTSRSTKILQAQQRTIFKGEWHNKDLTLQLKSNGHYHLIQKPSSNTLIYKGYWWIKHMKDQSQDTSLCFSNLLEVQCTLVQMEANYQMITFSYAYSKYILSLKRSK